MSFRATIGPVLMALVMLNCCILTLTPVVCGTEIKQLTGGALQGDVHFETAGKNATQTITLPKESYAVSASLDLEGLGLKPQAPTSTDYDFNDSVNNQAWWGASNVQSAGDPSNYKSNAFVAQDYPNIAKSDDIYKDTTNIQNQYAYHHFAFAITETGITSISVVWEGGGVATSMIGNGGANVFIYNNNSGQWEAVGNFACGDVWCEQTVKNTFSLYPERYPDDNGMVHVLATTRSAGNSNRITTDFVKIVVSGMPLSYPNDAQLDVGDNGSYEWTRFGHFMNKVTISNGTFLSEINSLIAAAGKGPGDVIIKLALVSTSPGIIRISNISIVLDDPPALLGDIPSNWSFPEDTDAQAMIHLYDYFKDDIDASLGFSVIFESNSSHIDASIGANGALSFFTPTENWWGSEAFIIRATDYRAKSVDSNIFNVTVTPVNDKPMITNVVGMWVNESETLNFQVFAKDDDMKFDPTEYLRFSSNSTLFLVNPITGIFNFSAREKDIGDHVVNFSVKDKSGEEDWKVSTISVVDVKHKPVIEPIADRTVKEDERFTLQIKAKDLDSQDTLTYSCMDQLFKCSETGLFDVMPLQKDVGKHNVRVMVTDGAFQDVVYFNITVEDVNDPPYVVPPANQTADNRRDFVFVFGQGGTNYADGYDAYYNNTNTFSDDSPLFDVDPATGNISFRPKASQAGRHVINITVTDKKGLTYHTVMNLTIVVKNDLPVVDIALAKQKTPAAGSQFTLVAKATDKDGDPLTYKWYGPDGTTLLGTGANLTQKAGKAGKYTYTVKVSDGIGESSKSYTLVVKAAPKGFIPGAGVECLVAALAVAALAVTVKRRFRPGDI